MTKFQLLYNNSFHWHCHSVVTFSNSNILTSFNSIPCKHQGSPHITFQRSKDIVSLLKYGEHFLEKTVIADRGTNTFLRNLWGCILKTLPVHYASGVEDFMQRLSSFSISLVVTCTLVP